MTAITPRHLLLWCLFVPMTTAPLFAADRDWSNVGGGIFANPFNWENQLMPGAADRAIFNLDSNYTVTFTTSPTNARVRVGDDTVTFNLSTQTYTLTSASPESLSIGGGERLAGSDIGTLTLLSGVLTTAGTELGGGGSTFPRVGSGTLIVSTGATWNDSGIVSVGAATPGALQIINGGDATSLFVEVGFGATGTATVSGVGSTWTINGALDVGATAPGTLNALAGGVVIVNGDAWLGASGGVNGNVTISGPQSRLTADDIRVGALGTGSLIISSGGTVISRTGSDNRLADQFATSANLTLTAGTWIANGSLMIGNLGNASVQINAGSTLVASQPVTIAQTAFSIADVSLIGTGAALATSGGLYVGGGLSTAGGAGTLTIGTGATATATPFRIWNTGLVTLSGGKLATSTGQLLFAPGTLAWQSGTIEFSTSYAVQDGATFGAVHALASGQHLRTTMLTIGGTSSGSITVNDGAFLDTAEAIVGDSPSIHGDLTIDGPTALMTSGAGIVFARAGTANASIINGGRLETYPDANQIQGIIGLESGSHGQVQIDGPDSEWSLGAFPLLGDLIVGDAGSAIIEVLNGATLRSHYSGANLGRGVGGSGFVTVCGPGSQWLIDTYDLIVGYDGYGELEVCDGGTVDLSVSGGFTGLISIGQVYEGDVNISGAGSTLTGDIVVAGDGLGTLSVAAQGAVYTDTLVSAKFPTGHGTILVDGVGSSITCDGDFGQFIIGGAGTATASITGSAFVQCIQSIIADGTGSQGTVAVGNGSQLSASEEILVGFSGTGLLVVESGGSATAPFVDINELSRLEGAGLMTGDVFNAGTLAPGPLSQTLTIDGNYHQSATGTFAVDLAGPPEAPQNDKLYITGTAMLDGVLIVDTSPGFVPLPGTEFEILSAADVQGDFVGYVATNTFLIIREQTRVVLRSCDNRPAGDYDCTGAPGLADHQPFTDCLAGPQVPYTPPSCTLSDFDADGDVDLADAAAFYAAFTDQSL